MKKTFERVQFRGGWHDDDNGGFAVTLQIFNIVTAEDRDLILTRVGTMMERLLIEAQQQEDARGAAA